MYVDVSYWLAAPLLIPVPGRIQSCHVRSGDFHTERNVPLSSRGVYAAAVPTRRRFDQNARGTKKSSGDPGAQFPI